MTMEAAVACPVRPQVDTGWLALPLSARGIIDELGKYTDENARVLLQLDDGADADAVGREIARLLCAHPGELAGVKRDTKKLLDRGDIAVDGSAIRLSRIAHETARSVVERPRAMTDAERARLHRDRQRALREQALEASRDVTAERDDFRDDRHDASVTSSLSLKNDPDLKSLREREAVTQIVTVKRDVVPAKVNEARRAKAKELGLQEHRIDLVWAGFVAKHPGQKKTERGWDERWAWWAANQLVLESANGPPAASSVAKATDEEPLWIREAMGDK
jgi:hypothetical protein